MKNLGLVLRKWRVVTEMESKDAAAQMGISTRALTKLEQNGVCDSADFCNILGWLTQSGAPAKSAVDDLNMNMDLDGTLVDLQRAAQTAVEAQRAVTVEVQRAQQQLPPPSSGGSAVGRVEPAAEPTGETGDEKR